MAMSPNLRRKLAYGSNAMLMTVLVVILVGMLVDFVGRHRVRIDLSADGRAGLEAETTQKINLVLSKNQELKVTVFTHQEGGKDSYHKNRFLKDFVEKLGYSSDRVRANLVDFDRERRTAEDLGATQYGHVVIQAVDANQSASEWSRVDIRARELFRGATKSKNLTFLGEAVFRRAVTQLLSDRRQKIYALVGHGERSVRVQEPNGLSGLVSLLDQENYDLESLDLYLDRQEGEAPRIPEDADALLIAGPKSPLSDAEAAAVQDFVSDGGDLMILLEPEASVPLLLTGLDVGLLDGLAMDTERYWQYDDRPIPQYRNHAITTPLKTAELQIMLARIAAIRAPGDAPPWLKWASLLETSRSGWIDRGGALQSGLSIYESDVDFLGPSQTRRAAPMMAMAMELMGGPKSVVRDPQDTSRVVVVGDTDFVTNQLIASRAGNPAFVVNSIRWMLGHDERLGVTGPTERVRRLNLSKEEYRDLRWIVLGFLPFLTSIFGAFVWFSRRGR